MTQVSEPSRNSAAHREFESWKDGVLEKLNQVSTMFVQEQRAMVDAMVSDPNIEFRVKLKLLSLHVGDNDICYAAGFSEENRNGWMLGTDIPSPARQVLILSLCKTIVFEALETSFTLSHMITIIGQSKIEHYVSSDVWPQIRSFRSVEDHIVCDGLPFDPATRIRFGDYSKRVSNCFKTLGIEYVGQLVSCTEKELLDIPNFGKASAREVKEVMAMYGADPRLGMKHPALDKFLEEHPLPESILIKRS